MILLALLGCGVDGGLDQPNPPPEPPPQLTQAEPDVVRQSGLVSEVHGPTRSFVLTGEGKRVIAHLRDSGTLRLGGKPSQVADLVAGTSLWVEGKRQGDLLVVVRAGDTPDVDAPVVTAEVPAGIAPDATAPSAAEPPAAPPAEPPAEPAATAPSPG